MSQETFNTQFNFQGFNTLKKDLREATQLYQQMLQSGTATTQQMEQQARKIAELKDRIDDANDATAALTGAGRIQAFGRAITAVSGGFTALQGVIALTGSESEDLQKTMVKLQAAMSITMGLSQLEDFGNAMKNAARATGLQTVAMKAYTFVTNGATVATRVFRGVLLSLGAGAILVGIGLLIQKLSEAYETFRKIHKLSETIGKTEAGNAQVATELLLATYEKRYKELAEAAERGEKGIQEKLNQLNQQAQLDLVSNFVRNKKIRKQEFEERKKEIQDEIKLTEENLGKALELIAKFGNVITKSEFEDKIREFLGLTTNADMKEDIQKGIKNLQNIIKVKNQELELLTENFKNSESKSLEELKEMIKQKSAEIQKILDANSKETQAKRKQEREEETARFKQSVSEFEQAERTKFEAEKNLKDLQKRLNQATAKDDADAKEKQFKDDREMREKELQDEINLSQALKKMYEDRNAVIDQNSEEYKDNQKEIAKLDTNITNLKVQQNKEKEVSDAEYTQLAKELADERLKKEKETNDAIIEEQRKLTEEFEKNLDDQLSVIDKFYERKKRAAFTGLENQSDFDKKERKIEMEKLKRQIRLLEFLGQSTEEQEFRLRALKKETADEEVRIRVEAANAVLAIGQASFQGLLDLDNIRLQNVLRNENISNVEKERVAKESFERQKALNKAMAIMDAAKTVSSIYAQWPKWDGGFMMYAALALAAIQLGVAFAKINEAQYVSPVTSGAGESVNLSSKFAMGGMLIGPSHSQGGIKTAMGELEGGEFVVNRIASQAFLPILEKINSVGQSYSERMMTNQNPQTPIIKTYVVATDMDSALEKKRKIEKLARL